MVDKSTIIEWLGDMSLGFEDLGEEESFQWALRLDQAPLRMLVAQMRTELNHLVMQTRVRLSDEHRQALLDLSKDDRDRFMFDLRIALFQAPVGVQLEMDEEDETILEAMTFGYNVMEDPLQRSGFFRRRHQIQSTALVAIQLIRKMARFSSW